MILESISLTNGEDVLSSIENKSIGIKINPTYLNLKDTARQNLISVFDKYFEKCHNLKLNNAVYGVQFLIKNVTFNFLNKAIDNDALYEFLKCKLKPWAKQLPEFIEFENSNFDESKWHNFEKTMQSEAVKHGKISKGAKPNSICEKYNDGEWSLEVPNSYEEARAVSYCIKDGQRAPTKWCTRADIRWFNDYTHNGKTHLYIIKNLKSGKAYQIAFAHGVVNFLDENDEDGDEITGGDLTKIPNKLLSLIKDETANSPRTLLDYKSAKTEQETPSKNKLTKNEYWNNDYSKLKTTKPKECESDPSVMYAGVTNYSAYMKQRNAMDEYFRKDVDDDYENPKDKVIERLLDRDYAIVFYLKDEPKYKLIYDPNNGIIMSNFPGEKSEEERKVNLAMDGMFYKREVQKTKEKMERGEKITKANSDRRNGKREAVELFEKYTGIKATSDHHIIDVYTVNSKGEEEDMFTRFGDVIKISDCGFVIKLNTDAEIAFCFIIEGEEDENGYTKLISSAVANAITIFAPEVNSASAVPTAYKKMLGTYNKDSEMFKKIRKFSKELKSIKKKVGDSYKDERIDALAKGNKVGPVYEEISFDY